MDQCHYDGINDCFDLIEKNKSNDDMERLFKNEKIEEEDYDLASYNSLENDVKDDNEDDIKDEIAGSSGYEDLANLNLISEKFTSVKGQTSINSLIKK